MTESESSQIPNLESLPENLPPVEPPSGKIVAQLFLVPGVIVLSLACAWLMLTRLASTDQDWRALVRGVDTPNEHERWRSAFGLAQLLQSDSHAPANERKHVTNPELAQVLGKMFTQEIRQPSKGEDDLEKRIYLATTLGLFMTPGEVLPALRLGLETEDQGVRNAAMRSIATVLGHGIEGGTVFDDPETLQAVIAATADSKPLNRSLATYTLGMFPLKDSQSRLEILLKDPDEDVRANAAIALTRHKSLSALPQLKQMLSIETAPSASDPNKPLGKDEELFSRRLQVLNAVTAIGKLQDVLPENEKLEIIPIIESLANKNGDPSVRVQAQNLLISLKGM